MNELQRAFADRERHMEYISAVTRTPSSFGLGLVKLDLLIEWCDGTWPHDPIGGSGFGIPDDGSFEPKPGALAILWGRGLGFPVRGIAIRNPGDDQFHVAYYRTEREQREKDRQSSEAWKANQRAEFEANRAEHDADYDALPAIFKARIDRFREEKPDFRWESEPYEVFCLKQAVVFADALKTLEAVKEFRDLPYEEQRKRVPEMDDGHSGNTFSAACALAAVYLRHQVGEQVSV